MIVRRLALAVACILVFAAANDRPALVKQVEERGLMHGVADAPADTPQSLVLLFGDDAKAAGMSVRELTMLYEAAYRRGAAKRSIWSRLQPRDGWIVAVLVLIGWVFQDAFKRLGTKVASHLGTFGYNRLAGFRLLRGIAQRRYRTALREKYGEFAVTFQPGRKLEMSKVYVPLIVRDTANRELDILSILREPARVLVLGVPGSGKSLLLRSLALAYGENSLGLEDRPVPVLVELSGFGAEGAVDVVGKVVEVLASRDFPRATSFVENALRDGYLMLLFDGLDEVLPERRDEVALRINELMDTHRNCRFVVTCRGPVYHGEFDENLSSQLEVAELSDQQIIAFLRPWQKSFPKGKTVQQLMQTLRDKPPIMRLVRNPLLLTIVALLYEGEDFVLPRSRTAFYKAATDFLLRGWKERQNKFDEQEKQIVLQHLALYNHASNEDSQDRRSMSYEALLREIRNALPRVQRDAKDAEPMRDEIVERSGLLMSIDGGARYQFAHLTLQEYFAAVELMNKPDRLIAEFRADPDGWREVVKLWCGLGNDSTRFIQEIRTFDPLAALECLGDVQQIDPTAAEAIVEEFKAAFVEGKETSDRIQQAFAALAADPRPRGVAMLGFLRNAMESGAGDQLRTAAATTLSLTNLPRAAELLVRVERDRGGVGDLIVRMGDVAIGAILGGGLRVDDAATLLGEIRTPEAIKQLIELLYDEDADPAVAYVLGSHFTDASTRDAIAAFPFTDAQLKLPSMPWVWAPFETDEDPGLTYVAGRIVAILEKNQSRPTPSLDPRLLRAICVRRRIDLDQKGVAYFAKTMANLELVRAKVLEDHFIAASIPPNVVGSRLITAVASLPPADRFRVAKILGRADDVTIEDWKNLRTPASYEFATSWHLRLLVTLQFGFSAIAFVTAAVSITRAQSISQVILPGIVIFSIFIAWRWRWTKMPGYDARGVYRAYPTPAQRLEEWGRITLAFLIAPASLVTRAQEAIQRFFHRNRAPLDDRLNLLLLLPVMPFTPGMLFYGIYGIRWTAGPPFAVTVAALLVIVVALTAISAKRRARIARNPLAGILEALEPEPIEHMRPKSRSSANFYDWWTTPLPP